MTAEAILTVSAATVTLVQLCKWGRLVPDSWGPVAVLAIALVGVVLWGVSTEPGFSRGLVWPYFAGWVAVATSAAGVYGYARAITPGSLTRMTPPPPGVAQDETGKVG
jgi:hypothetical protein